MEERWKKLKTELDSKTEIYEKKCETAFSDIKEMIEVIKDSSWILPIELRINDYKLIFVFTNENLIVEQNEKVIMEETYEKLCVNDMAFCLPKNLILTWEEHVKEIQEEFERTVRYKMG